MQIVIDIDEKRFQDIQRISEVQMKRRTPTLEQVVANGTPLPKHGDLIDRKELNDSLLHNWHGNNKNIVPYADRRGYGLREREVEVVIINAPTIIEADKAESEEQA